MAHDSNHNEEEEEGGYAHGPPAGASSSSSSNTRRASSRRRGDGSVDPEYASVPINDEDLSDGNDHGAALPEYQNRPSTRTRRAATAATSSTSCRLYVGILVTVTVITGLWYVQRHFRYATAGASSSTIVTSPHSDAGAMPKSLCTADNNWNNGASNTNNGIQVEGHVIHYNPSAVNNHNSNNRGSPAEGAVEDLLVAPPEIPNFLKSSSSAPDDSMMLGYLKSPTVYNNSIIAVCEGDLYYARIDDSATSTAHAAMKLTTTVGNVQTPKFHPTVSNYVAFTATYTGTRDVYLYNLQTRFMHRLSYGFDSPVGIVRVIGWKNTNNEDDNKDTSHLLVAGYSTTSKHLPSTILYELDVNLTAATISAPWTSTSLSSASIVVGYRPLPLAQAIDGAHYKNCLYFVRYTQGSHTARYIGGTVEQIWRYCDSDVEAHLITPLQGTSKSPSIANYNGIDYLLYLSDREPSSSSNQPSSQAKPTSMNLWALPLSSPSSSTSKGKTSNTIIIVDDDSNAIPLTRISCQFNGMVVREYAVDPITQHVTLRIGGNVYQLTSDQIASTLLSSTSSSKATDSNNNVALPQKLDVRVYSDFQGLQERLLPISDEMPIQTDVIDLSSGISTLLTIRGQVWMAPVVDAPSTTAEPYAGSGQNIPRRRYRILPSSAMGGSVRVLGSWHVPLLLTLDDPRRVALVLATDPWSPTAEHAFYLVEVHESSMVIDLTRPALGGHLLGGSTANGGLGSIIRYTVAVSPCGRRLAWADTDGRICLWTLPTYGNRTTSGTGTYHVLPSQNDLGEPMDGTTASLAWSPGGRYLAVSHAARNQFEVISIVDCGDPTPPNNTSTELEIPDIQLGRIVQVTSNRFNSNSMYWGKSAMDYYVAAKAMALGITDLPAATTLYFLTDRDVTNDVMGPWGPRAPSPHFTRETLVYALPLTSALSDDWSVGRFAGGGAQEIFGQQSKSLTEQLTQLQTDEKTFAGRRLQQVVNDVKDDIQSRRLNGKQGASVVRWLHKIRRNQGRTAVADASTVDGYFPNPAAITNGTINPGFPVDMVIDFGSNNGLSLARRAYRMGSIPKGRYLRIVSQLLDDPSLITVEIDSSYETFTLKVLASEDFPSDVIVPTPVAVTGMRLSDFGQSTSRRHTFFQFAPGTKIRVVGNTIASLSEFLLDSKGALENSLADTKSLALSVYPQLEYRQMYNDAWRLLRDYFYDTNMHGVDWLAMHERFLPLVERCVKREDLDDILEQLASELSALHVFVYGGEYDSPFANQPEMLMAHEPASLGVTLERAPEWHGYRITEIPQRDPDFNLVDGMGVFCPLSDATLRLSGQRGLLPGDVIVAINGESVDQRDIYSLLRGATDRTVRLEVLRLASGSNVTRVTNHTAKSATTTTIKTSDDNVIARSETVITTAMDRYQALDLRYHAWEWQTRAKAQQLATEHNFTVAYIHLRSMLGDDVNAFARDFYPDYDKDALILDVRNNGGGMIDSWILTALQRKAWMYWRSRSGARKGNIDWDEQFAFRGHIVVLINEHSGSDAEGVARGISELGLGRLIGTRTWGGGIWLSSDNGLVDGGIATAPEIGTFNSKFGFGMGIENVGIEPDVVVDNNPRTAFDGKDTQLERAILELKQWLEDEPVVIPRPPKFIKDVSLHEDDCPA